MGKKYTIAIAGLGNRGYVHVNGILSNPDRFDLVAICDINPERLNFIAEKIGYSKDKTYLDADTMLTAVKPDVFVFVTHPDIRLEMVKLAVKHKVKGLALEKPMATSLHEAAEMTKLCIDNGIKATVSHQHKYLPSLRSMKSVIDSGDIGEIRQMNVSTQAWMSQLGTHYMDYALWANDQHRANWVVGHVHGRGKLTDNHPSPDYIMGQVALENGVRLFIENGYLSRPNLSVNNPNKFWVDDRLTVCGTKGFVWAEADGAWGGYYNGEIHGGCFGTWEQEQLALQTPYFTDLADWLDDDKKVHPCNIDISCHGYEILDGLCWSALDNRPVHFPVNLAEIPDVLKRMDAELK